MSDMLDHLGVLHNIYESRKETAPISGVWPRRGKDGRPYVSPSQVSLVLECGEKYRRKYVLGEPATYGESAYFGTVFHAVMESVLREQLWRNSPVHPDSVREHALRVAQTAFLELPPWVKEAPESSSDLQLSDLAGLAAEWIMREDVRPLMVEAPVTRALMDVDVSGRLDAYAYSGVSGRYVVIDWKSAGKSPSFNEFGRPVMKRSHAHASLEYAHALRLAGHRVDEVLVGYAIRTKTPKFVVAALPVNQVMLDWADNVTRGAVNLIRLGAFAANPSSFLCSESYCDYWHSCPASAAPLEVA